MSEPKGYKAKLADFKPDPHNLNKHTQRGRGMVEASQRQRGFGRPGFAAKDGTMLGGNLSIMEVAADIDLGDGEVFVVETDGDIPVVHLRRDLAAGTPEAVLLAAEDNKSALISIDFDPERFAEEIAQGVDFSGIFTDDEQKGLLAELGTGGPEETGDPPTDKAAELQAEYGTALGQVWQLGDHRLACGDCTDRAVVEAVMGGEKAILLHADPPYGMGKEKDGIANDNLYREKLDAFQMQWWDACRPAIEDNGSGYIWGNAEDLWRLWYVGGLKDRERLTFRNEAVWDKANESGKYDGNGIGSGIGRQFANISERCLFFMLGEQGFNNNADNYWEGWEPIRAYLKGERDKMGWDNAKCKTLAGHSPKSGCHWFDSSQWSFVTEDVYKAWQQAAKGLSFKRDYDELKRDYDELKRDYDELKRDFYATRAYFNNTHDNMTDVWHFGRVTDEDRWGHATPKPVAMIERIINSSARPDTIVLDPFIGSGTTLIAAHQLNRRCRGIELDPGYCAVTIKRWEDLTGDKAELL